MTDTDAMFSGYHQWDDNNLDAYEEHIGPFLLKKGDDEAWTTITKVHPYNVNALGICHGGVLMSFADFTVFATARDNFDDENIGVTVSMNCDFISSAMLGDVVIGRGEITRVTRSMIFGRGGLYVGDKCLLTYSAVLKRIKLQ